MTEIPEELRDGNYSIMYRIYKDTAFFRGWFKNLEPQWSKWYNLFPKGFNTIPEARVRMKSLEEKAPYSPVKKEYKIVRNGN